MSNEEVCKQALRNLENINLDIVLDELGYEKAEEVSVYGINDYPTLEKQGDIDVLRELIKEHFSNPPLEWEEIKVNDVIFDKEIKETIKIKDKFIFDDIKNISFEIFGSNRTYAGTYEEKRFYRKEVKNVD